jgi:hypothetical protein
MTMNTIKKIALAGTLALAGLAAIAPAAQATFHEVRIRAVFKGPMDASFVMLQMTAPGQTATAGKSIDIYGATGNLIDNSFVLPVVANVDTQRYILMGDTATAGSPDLVAPLLYDILNPLTGGAVCFENIDCMSFGAFTGNAMLPSSAGTPVGSLSSSQVNARKISANCATALDSADDTNDSLGDFVNTIGFPPRNNSVTPAETVCPPPATPIATTTATTPTTKKCKKGRKLKRGKCVKKKRKKK